MIQSYNLNKLRINQMLNSEDAFERSKPIPTPSCKKPMTFKEKTIINQINKLDLEESKNQYKIKRMVDDVRSSHNGSRT